MVERRQVARRLDHRLPSAIGASIRLAVRKRRFAGVVRRPAAAHQAQEGADLLHVAARLVDRVVARGDRRSSADSSIASASCVIDDARDLVSRSAARLQSVRHDRLLSARCRANRPTPEQPCARQAPRSAADDGRQRAELDLGQQRRRRQQPGRKEQREGEAARRGQRDHDQLAPADAPRQVEPERRRQSDGGEDAERPADRAAVSTAQVPVS